MIDEHAHTLRHTDLTVPHLRLRVTSLQHLERNSGIAYTATLSYDGVPVGTIDNDGNGGQTWLIAANSARRAANLDEYFAACRLGDSTPGEDRVLDALINEYDFDQQIAALTGIGGTLARLYLADGGYTLALAEADPYRPAERLLEQLRSDFPDLAEGTWQIWDTDRWTPVGPAL